MLLNPYTQKHLNDAFEPRRNLRIRQADRFEALAAATEAENICPFWVMDRLADRDEVTR